MIIYQNIIKKSFIILLGLAILWLSACKSVDENRVEVPTISNQSSSQVVLTDAQMDLAKIVVADIQKTTLGGNIQLNGKIDIAPQNIVSISAPIGGFVKSFKWMTGMKIEKGQLVVSVEDREIVQLQQDYLLAKSAHYYAEKEYERQSILNKSQATSDKLLMQSEELVRMKRIEMKSLEQKLNLINIRVDQLNDQNITSKVNIYAPISGYIEDINVNTGKYVVPSEKILSIMNVNNPMVTLKAFEKDLPSLSVGQKILAHTNNEPSKQYIGRISYLSKAISNDGYAEVLCKMEKADGLLPGTYLIADVAVSAKESYTLPEDAIVTFEDQDYVFLMSDKSKFEMVSVTTGVTENNQVEIINSTALLDKKIVTKGAYTLLMKMKNVEE